MAQITVFVSHSDFTLTSERLSATLGVSTTESVTQTSWVLKTPRNTQECKLVLKAIDEGQVGISEVKFWVARGSKPPPTHTVGAIDWLDDDDDKAHLLPRGRVTTQQSGEPRAT